jgi:enoyl-CoA hydratase
MALINFNIHNNIGLLIANRPEVRNTLNEQAMNEFAAAVEQAQDAPNLLALIITGAGKAFISGGDIGELHSLTVESDRRRWLWRTRPER